MTSADKRKWPRMAIALDVKMRFETLDAALIAHTVNVSREGLYLAGLTDPRPLGTRVRIGLSVGSPKQEFQLEGVVVRSDEDGVAVFLTSATDGWERFCDDLERRGAEGVTKKDRPTKLRER